MKVYTKILVIILLSSAFISISHSGYSQHKRLKKADETYEAGEYYTAIGLYQSAMRKIKNKREKINIHYNIGECYFNINNFRKARTNYRKAIRGDFAVEAYYKLGLTSKLSGDYEAAIKDFKKALEIYPSDTLSILGVESCELSLQWIEERSRFKAEKFKHTNSKENDFCPSVVEKSGYDHLYFSSTRKEAKGKKTSGITGEKFSDLFLIKLDKQGKWSKAEALDSINTEFDEGSCHLANDGRDLYYTSCKKEKGKNLGCQIFKASKIDGIWMNPEKVDILADSISFGHPALSPDGTVLYFSSRKDGGFGGADLWYCEKDESGGWGKPKNMGPEINTPGDELFPFVRNDGVLYFSSDRHPSMGGLDIFKAYKDEDKKWVVVNLKPPFNSNGNDFGIYYYANEEKGFFTSDRRGSKKEDIYYFEKPPVEFAFEGIVKDLDTKRVIDSAVVILYGSDGSMFTDTTSQDKLGRFRFKLKPKTDYVYLVTKDQYFNGKGRLTTDTLDFDHTFDREIMLETTNKTFEIPNIEFEFAKWALVEESKVNLNNLIQLLRDNPNLIIELSAHTDMIGSAETNLELSNKRIESVRQYLIEYGIPAGRMQGIGHGKAKPKHIIRYDENYPWLEIGTVLNEEYVLSLDKDKQEIANQMNRRIEFRVIGNNYIPDLD
ncbi:MAG: OmpA family protein [Bacteroidales bacterium]|nr:OmpA family protein [Bacteroidales bacterium]